MSIRETREPSRTFVVGVKYAEDSTPKAREGRVGHNADIEKNDQKTINVNSGEGEPATEEEIRDLLHVVDDIPLGVWLAQLMGAAERFTWYGSTGPLQNYLQHSPHSDIPGALGLSQATASNIISAFLAVSQFTSIPAAIIADSWLGRYRTLFISAITVLCGVAILFATSFPNAIQNNAAAPGVYTAMVLMSLGSGGVKTAVAPFMASQYKKAVPTTKTLKSGERAVTDRELTIRYIYNAYYWVSQIGGLGALGTTLLERYVGFWSAYLAPLCVMGLGIMALLLYRHKFVKGTSSSNVIPKASGAMLLGIRSGFRMDAAKPREQFEMHRREIPWSDVFVDELKSGLKTCRILLFFPIHWICLNQTFNNLISQAGTMIDSGVPNDTIKSLNPISGIIMTPLIQKILYPFLTRRRIRFGPIARFTLGYAILTFSMTYTAILQHIIYSSPPCYAHPRECPASRSGRIPNHVSMFLQAPIYVTGSLAEIFCITTGSEYAYNQAPSSMKTVVQAFWLSMAGIGGVLAMALTPLAVDPQLVILYAMLAGLMGTTTIVFWAVFRKSDQRGMDMID